MGEILLEEFYADAPGGPRIPYLSPWILHIHQFLDDGLHAEYLLVAVALDQLDDQSLIVSQQLIGVLAYFA